MRIPAAATATADEASNNVCARMLHDGGEQSSWSCLFENNLNSSNEFYLRSNNSSNDNNNYHKSTARYTTLTYNCMRQTSK